MERITLRCERCHKPFSYTADGKGSMDTLCKECRERIEKLREDERKAQVLETRQCKDCGATFDITVGQKEWYESKNFLLPVRCPVCRRERKKAKEEAQKNG